MDHGVTHGGQTRGVRILLVEDNPGDAVLVQKALAADSAAARLFVVSDGDSALAFLRREPPYAVAPQPDLVLLDLNLPRTDGRVALSRIKSDPAFKHVPVIIFTSSEAASDVIQSYRLGANCYVPKPVTLLELQRVLRTLVQFWSETARLPSDET